MTSVATVSKPVRWSRRILPCLQASRRHQRCGRQRDANVLNDRFGAWSSNVTSAHDLILPIPEVTGAERAMVGSTPEHATFALRRCPRRCVDDAHHAGNNLRIRKAIPFAESVHGTAILAAGQA